MKKGIKSAIAVSALSTVLCAGMLVGTTFAWFSDSVSSTGNSIKAGNLEIEATAASLTEGAPEYTLGGYELAFGEAVPFDGEAIINEAAFAPGEWNAKLITVSNAEENLAAKVKVDFVVTDDGLEDALWFDFVKVENGEVKGTFTEKPMSMLEEAAQNVEVTLTAGTQVSFIFIYGMNGEAGEEYEGLSFGVDAYILAKQTTEGAQYDESVIRVADEESLAEAVAEGKTAILTQDVEVSVIPTNPNGDTIINLGGNTLTSTQTGSSASAAAGETISISNGTIIANSIVEESRTVLGAESGGTVEVDNVTFTTNSTALFAQGEGATLRITDSVITARAFCVGTNAGGPENFNPIIEISGSTLKNSNEDSSGYYGSAVFFNVPGKLTIKDSYIEGDTNAVMARGGDITIRNSTLSRPHTPTMDESTFYMSGPWGGGNSVPMATLLIGNRNSNQNYHNKATVTLENCTITADAAGAKTVYIYGNESANIGATLNLDAATTITPANANIDPIIVGGGYVTLNLGEGPHDLSKLPIGTANITIAGAGADKTTIVPVMNASADYGAIVVQGASGASLTVKDIAFVGNGQDGGRGIVISGQQASLAMLTVENCAFDNFTTGIYLGGVAGYDNGADSAAITNCTFANCTAGIGGSEGITGTLKVEGGSFTGCGETIGWAGAGTLHIVRLNGISFNDYHTGAAVSVTVANDDFTQVGAGN